MVIVLSVWMQGRKQAVHGGIGRGWVGMHRRKVGSHSRHSQRGLGVLHVSAHAGCRVRSSAALMGV